MKTLIVDGTNIAMRSIRMAEKMTKLSAVVDGVEVDTTGTFLFINILTRYVREEKPDRIVVCWDGGRSRHRLAIFPEYKADRISRDGEDETTFKLVKQFLTLNSIHHVEFPGVEADDLVAAYTRVRELEGDDEVVILSGDKDFLQLLCSRVSQIRPKSKPEKWRPEDVWRTYDCAPEQLTMVMALTGDHSDGIPGIPGFGNKTAVKFLKKYGWVMETLLAAQEPKLLGMEAAVRRNLALVTLHPIAEGEYENAYVPLFDNDPIDSPLWEELVDWFRKYDMGSLESRLAAGVLWREPLQGQLLQP